MVMIRTMLGAIKGLHEGYYSVDIMFLVIAIKVVEDIALMKKIYGWMDRACQANRNSEKMK